MQVLEKKESKLLGRTDVEVLFNDKAGALTRKEAVKELAQSMKVEEGRVALLKLSSGAGVRDVVGSFRVYDSEVAMQHLSPGYLKERLMTKEEREAAKAAKKKAEQAAAQAKQQAGKK